MLKPFKSRMRFDAPKAMHGAPVTVQVTSPTSRLFSVIVSVAVIVPLISIACAVEMEISNVPIKKRVQRRVGIGHSFG
jgi:hypothetical protein